MASGYDEEDVEVWKDRYLALKKDWVLTKAIVKKTKIFLEERGYTFCASCKVLPLDEEEVEWRKENKSELLCEDCLRDRDDDYLIQAGESHSD